MITMRRIFCMICTLIVLILSSLTTTPSIAQSRDPVYLVEVDGTLSNVTVEFLRRALREAEAANANALIMQLDLRGSVLEALRPFAGEIFAASIPVIVYVAPPGTEAGTGGTLLLSAAHLAAMAPDTRFGSAIPLTTVETALSTQTQQLVLDSVADQLRDWQSMRGRATDWIDRAVSEGAILSNQQAINNTPPVIDLVAADRQELLTLLANRVVTLADGRTVTLNTLGVDPRALQPNAWEQLRLLLAQPTSAFLLLILGCLAIYFELASPGTSVFAGLGGVLLIGALLGFVALPVQWWALLLVIGAFVLVGADLYTPSHGGLTIAGLALMVIGALNLFDATQAPGVAVQSWAIVAVALAMGSFAVFGLWLALRARAQPVATGQEGLVGRLAEVRSRLAPDGFVFVEGALWRAVSQDEAIEPGEFVRVVAVNNLLLLVKRVEAQPAADPESTSQMA